MGASTACIIHGRGAPRCGGEGRERRGGSSERRGRDWEGPGGEEGKGESLGKEVEGREPAGEPGAAGRGGGQGHKPHPAGGGVPVGWSPVGLGSRFALPDEGPTESAARPPESGRRGSSVVSGEGDGWAGEPDSPPGIPNKACPPIRGPFPTSLPIRGPSPKPRWASGLKLEALQLLRS